MEKLISSYFYHSIVIKKYKLNVKKYKKNYFLHSLGIEVRSNL